MATCERCGKAVKNILVLRKMEGGKREKICNDCWQEECEE